METDKRHAGGVIRNFFLTELFANLVGAPLAVIYGGSLINFGAVSLSRWLLALLVIVIVNQFLLALPLNYRLSRQLRARLDAWLADCQDPDGLASLHRFLGRLPAIQGGLVTGRMFICSIAAVVYARAGFENGLHLGATLTYGLFASFITGLVIYYFLHASTTGLSQRLVRLYQEAGGSVLELYQQQERQAGRIALSLVPILVPSLLSSLAITLLIAVIHSGTQNLGFFTSRVFIAIGFNLLAVQAILLYNRFFSKRRLRAIQATLQEMNERGDTTRYIPSDLRDDHSLTAAQINQAFDLFRLVLGQLQSAANSLSGTVVRFSSQSRQTTAATSQQASAVKEIVSTMEGSNEISRQIEAQAKELTVNAAESRTNVDDGFGKVQDTIQKMNEIRGANQQTLSELGELTEEIASIGEIIEIINSIANQTRIIAFNAELEASSAGAAGASFRIVAEEIRRLANNTVDSLAGIKLRIHQIQQGSQRLQGTAEDETNRIGEGINLSAALNKIFMSVSASSEHTAKSAKDITEKLAEQNHAFEQIFTTLKQISEGAEQILNSTRDSGTDTAQLQSLMEEMRGVLSRFGYIEITEIDKDQP